MERRKKLFGILVILGFAMITILYLFVMSGTAEVYGTVRVDTQLVSWQENPPGGEDLEMVAANGYCIKGPDTENRMLLSTKNRFKTDNVKYSFTAKEGMRHLIVVYLALDHLTGDVGRTMDLQFLTQTVKKGDLNCDFQVSFDKIDRVDSILITVDCAAYGKRKVLAYPLSDIPDIIRL